jgi:hypothetical protein
MVLATHWHIKNIITRLSQKLRPQSSMMFYDFITSCSTINIATLMWINLYLTAGRQFTHLDWHTKSWMNNKSRNVSVKPTTCIWSLVIHPIMGISDRFTILQYINPIKSLWLTFLPRGLSIQSKFDRRPHVMWFHECLKNSVPLIEESWPFRRTSRVYRAGFRWQFQRFGPKEMQMNTQWNPKDDNFKFLFTTCQIHVNLFEDSSPHTFEPGNTNDTQHKLSEPIVVGRLAAHAL